MCYITMLLLILQLFIPPINACLQFTTCDNCTINSCIWTGVDENNIVVHTCHADLLLDTVFAIFKSDQCNSFENEENNASIFIDDTHRWFHHTEIILLVSIYLPLSVAVITVLAILFVQYSKGRFRNLAPSSTSPVRKSSIRKRVAFDVVREIEEGLLDDSIYSQINVRSTVGKRQAAQLDTPCEVQVESHDEPKTTENDAIVAYDISQQGTSQAARLQNLEKKECIDIDATVAGKTVELSSEVLRQNSEVENTTDDNLTNATSKQCPNSGGDHNDKPEKTVNDAVLVLPTPKPDTSESALTRRTPTAIPKPPRMSIAHSRRASPGHHRMVDTTSVYRGMWNPKIPNPEK